MNTTKGGYLNITAARPNKKNLPGIFNVVSAEKMNFKDVPLHVITNRNALHYVTLRYDVTRPHS